MQIKFTRAAEEDVVDSYLYGLTHFGLEKADEYEAAIRNTISLISENPEIAHARHEYSPPVRVHHTAKHYIVYLLNDDHVLVVRLLRDDMDLTRHL